ncbi:MarR family winged helix-turn-helix transcriptional regulator [Noviherbaspirillum sp. UKPF54]|uniref:MarR family winged helix-turn-helix transcriptional regulator n=1 Tax=Noviherbaspirillum sp. UKPF54 TaxID=2601898 RepID=UPI0011B19F30|nr:MarR family transcriptional regulator [Noviherbaspirillum sp. UKPF54]QDZ27842.1 MarR family transcriptional regulator [Noviherbaspirillum sp. UKPF54]
MANKGKKAGQATGSEAGLPHLDTLKKLRIVIRAAQRHSAWIEKQCGVAGAQLWLMQELEEMPGLRVGEIADRMAIHQTTVSNLLDTLEKRGMVVKTRDPVDQRAVRLALSDDGRKLLASAPKPARGLLPEALRQMEPEQLAQLDRGLQELLDSIGMLDESYGLQPMPFTM